MHWRKKVAFLLSAATALVPSASVMAASTMGTNISTDGLLSVTGASTLTGAVAMTNGFNAVASSTVGNDLTVSGDMLVSSTLQATGVTHMYGGFQSYASSTVSAVLTVSGAFRASSTLEVTGAAHLRTGFQSYASSTVGAVLQVSDGFFASSTVQVTGVTTFYGSIAGTSTHSGSVYMNASSSVGAALTVTGAFVASSTMQTTGLGTFYAGISIPASDGTQRGSSAGLVISSNFVSSSIRSNAGTTSSLELWAGSMTSTVAVVAQNVTGTLFVSTTAAAGTGTRLILIPTTGQVCAQMYVSTSLTVGQLIPAAFEGVACPDLKR